MFSRQLVMRALAIATLFLLLPEWSAAASKRVALPRRYNFEIDPKTPLAELLPTPPNIAHALQLTDKLDQLPELRVAEFGLGEDKNSEKAMAHVIAKINHLNKDNPDGFMAALLKSRADLRGLPFRMGKECRTDESRALLLSEMVRSIHSVAERTNLEMFEFQANKKKEPDQTQFAKTFFKRLEVILKESKRTADTPVYKASEAAVNRALIAAFAQMLIPGDLVLDESPKLVLRGEPRRLEMVALYAKMKEADASRALAQLAIFAPEDAVRTASIDSLKNRPANEYTATLLQGFRYPLPIVAQRASEAVAKLGMKAVIPDLIQMLDQPDPRTPAKQMIDGKEVLAMREVVRVNHHRNCILCHSPANVRGVPAGLVTAPVTLPDRPPQSLGGYGFGSSPDIFVRTDTNYLRQDFSLLMKVDNAKPWPEMQRFDFLVRTRVLTTEEAAKVTAMLGKTPPQHAAAHETLRALMGQQPEAATAAAWRKLLEMP